MNRRLILSAGIIVFVGAAAIGATGAFFSDVETSTGNTFTAGAIDLKIDSTQHYNGNVCADTEEGEGVTYQWVGTSAYPVPGTPCNGTWNLVNLLPTHKFFDFTDVKPGDEGENTISLHIDNNPAWACADIRVTSNEENTRISPEINAGDLTDGPGNGELAQHINVFAWLDNGSTSNAVAGDNIYQPQDGEIILAGPLAAFDILGSTTTLPLADSITNSGVPLNASSTHYIGLAWCAGIIGVDGTTGAISCDGSTVDNQAQTDSMTADIAFRVEQHRNNEKFVCRSNTVD